MHLRRTCSAAAAFGMLLRLKVYLKSAYGLTAARCQSYKPNDATKVLYVAEWAFAVAFQRGSKREHKKRRRERWRR